MGRLTPSNKEYQLLSYFIQEALELHGQDCQVFTPLHSVKDANMDNILYYENSIHASILFAEDLYNNKMKGKYWSKEKGENIEAYISIFDNNKLKVGSVVDITPNYYNQNAKFIVCKVEGQVNSIYLRVFLVPYRKSLAVDTTYKKDTSITEDVNGIIIDKPYLKR